MRTQAEDAQANYERKDAIAAEKRAARTRDVVASAKARRSL